jgi:ATP-binding cassette, subfamily G (WHITE), member 2, PDR
MPLLIPQTAQTESNLTGTTFQHPAPAGRIGQDEEPEEFTNSSERFEAIHTIATELSVHYSATAQELFGSPEGALDPNGPAFDSKVWLKSFYNLYRQELGVLTNTSGVAYNSLNVHGYGSSTDFQKTVGNVILSGRTILSRLFGNKGSKIQILTDFEGVLNSGEMLCVLGPPGSGCSTLLKTIAGETNGLCLDEKSYLNYKGITPEEMNTQFRGEATYTAEDDAHLPFLSVGDTLQFAALARIERNPPGGISKAIYAAHLRDVVLTALGISHTKNTHVGDNVSICEASWNSH